MTNPYQAFCEQRKTAHQFRALRPTEIKADGRAECVMASCLINFASNDYLGLSQHPALVQKSQEYAERYGAGSTASRLITGNNPLYDKVEAILAHGKGCEAALIMNSGYQANLTVLCCAGGCRSGWQACDCSRRPAKPSFVTARCVARRRAVDAFSS